VIERLENSEYAVANCDGANGLLQLPDKSIKLVYGSPPYPNAERDYGVWKSSDYIGKISPFIDAAVKKLRDDGFLLINVKATREKGTTKTSTKRSLVVEKLAIMLEEHWGLHCVDIEIWIKENPVPTGLRVACQDAYEQNLWFSVAPKWTINLDEIRRPYMSHSVKTYGEYEYKPRSNGLSYVRKNKHIQPNPLGALPTNIISGGVSSRILGHQATQPLYLPEKYIKAATGPGDLVVDPWMGSGTTGLAALALKRKFIGFDLIESYVIDAEERFKKTLKGG
jgi:DNA modification methylase